MKIECRAQGFILTPTIDGFVRDAVHSTLGRFSDDIVAVDLFMKDTNGPKGGIDQQVLIRVQMRGGSRPIALQTSKENMFAAIKVSTKRARRAVRRQIRKSRRFEKLSVRRLAMASGSSEAAKA